MIDLEGLVTMNIGRTRLFVRLATALVCARDRDRIIAKARDGHGHGVIWETPATSGIPAEMSYDT